MIKHPENPLLTPSMITPSHPNLVVKGALNPGAVQVAQDVLDASRAPIAGAGELIDSRAAHLDECEFRCDEEAVQQHEEERGSEPPSDAEGVEALG